MTDLSALRYTDEHEWIAGDGDTVTIGITDYAAEKLGTSSSSNSPPSAPS